MRDPHYLRYCDDFIIVSNDETYLRYLVGVIGRFLKEHLKLELHPRKVVIKKLNQGVDFVGYVLFEHHILLRTQTKKRLKKRLKEKYRDYRQGKISAASFDQTLQSYLGILSHANQHGFSQVLKNAYWIRDSNS